MHTHKDNNIQWKYNLLYTCIIINRNDHWDQRHTHIQTDTLQDTHSYTQLYTHTHTHSLPHTKNIMRIQRIYCTHIIIIIIITLCCLSIEIKDNAPVQFMYIGHTHDHTHRHTYSHTQTHT